MDAPKGKLEFSKIQNLTDRGDFEGALALAIQAMKEARANSDQKLVDNYRTTIAYILRKLDSALGVSGHRDLSCTFCGKMQEEVSKLIAGPSAFICNECIELCNKMVSEDSVEP